jgi:hypothetical protein
MSLMNKLGALLVGGAENRVASRGATRQGGEGLRFQPFRTAMERWFGSGGAEEQSEGSEKEVRRMTVPRPPGPAAASLRARRVPQTVKGGTHHG